MPQVNVRLTDENISIINTHREKLESHSFTEAINDLIANSSKMNEEQLRNYVERQDKLNGLILSLLESAKEGEEVKLIRKPDGRKAKKVMIEGKLFNSVKEASLELGLSQSAISQLTKSKPLTHFYINT